MINNLKKIANETLLHLLLVIINKIILQYLANKAIYSLEKRKDNIFTLEAPKNRPDYKSPRHEKSI
jgi:hypothetical protein